jgi:hypothetical protein
MSANLMFVVVFAAGWLAVAGSTVTRFMWRREKRRDIAVLAPAGLLIWFTGVIAAMFAEVRHWPAGQIAQLHGVGLKCKVTGFVLLVVGVALRLRSRGGAAGGELALGQGRDHA